VNEGVAARAVADATSAIPSAIPSVLPNRDREEAVHWPRFELLIRRRSIATIRATWRIRATGPIECDFTACCPQRAIHRLTRPDQ
jgi:hypothetical protein